MADLLDRLAFDEGITGRPEIPAHVFSGYWVLYVLGKRTRTEVKAVWDLQGDEAEQADLIADHVDSILKADAKHRYVDQVDAVVLLLKEGAPEYLTAPGVIDKAKISSDLDI